MFKTIWMLITGLGRQIDKLNAKLDALALRLEQVYILMLDIQAQLKPPPAVALVIHLGGVTLGEDSMLKVADTGSVIASLEADDALGNAGATLDSVPAWSLSDSELGSVNASEDGMSAVVVLSGKLGKFKVQASAKAAGNDLSAESEEIEVTVGAAALIKVAVASQ